MAKAEEPIKYVVMGLRRTLANCRVPQAYALAFGKVVGRMGIGVNEQTARRYYNASSGKSVAEQIVEIAQTSGITLTKQALLVACTKFDILVAGTPFEIVEGAQETLQQLRGMGIGIVISSNMPQGPLRAVIRDLGLKEYIDMHLGASQKIWKGPVHVKQCALRYGMEMRDYCRRAAFVGANPSDMISAVMCREKIGLDGWPLAIGVSASGTVSNEMLVRAGADCRAPDIARLADVIESINNGRIELPGIGN
jgi:phosphoglycolate phosphatase-like HAD superfamily hydrolase